MSALIEKINIKDNASFSIGIFQDNLEKCTWHYHDYYEISFITEGFGKRIVADSIEEFQPGDLIFLGRNLPHVWIANKEILTPNRRSLEMVFLQLPPESLKPEFLALPELKHVANAIKLSERGIRITGDTLNQVSNIMLQLPYLNNFERFLQFFRLMDIIGQSNDLVPLASTNYKNIHFETKNKRILTIHEYLMKNYRENIDLKEIASLVNMAEGSLCRFFKSIVGITIFEYLNKIKVDLACKLLMDKNLSVLDVAIDSGFNNISHFNKQFKTITGVTPKEYRLRFKD
ncbi:MAG: AraC family transcriptional regulator [Paludibacter sp.]|jgi:AraC-like DNA-binding protein